ncbi:MAG: small, acid-soluble spore protein, alpha/beta type [Clostridia bacterium]|nr:small, acid-soluble spore protein, alpha/beta type [Clostridia bacterium]MBP3650662.1 small, acid-soluble spore protein, alpha/beta type [Clostridia bacterium]
MLSGALRRSALTYLSQEEKRKYEIAREIGLLDKVRQVGWAGLSAKESGRIGGLMSRKHHTSKGD